MLVVLRRFEFITRNKILKCNLAFSYVYPLDVDFAFRYFNNHPQRLKRYDAGHICSEQININFPFILFLITSRLQKVVLNVAHVYAMIGVVGPEIIHKNFQIIVPDVLRIANGSF